MPQPTQKFYIYAGGVFEYESLLPCYREKYNVDVWKDERMWELAQNAGALWVHQALKQHKMRTLDPSEAELFFIPIDGWLSQKAGACNGKNHENRMGLIHKALVESASWKRHGGKDHVLVSLWWGTTKALGDSFAKLLQPR
jgi:hypothetical protein